jgi:hypothetical protein
LKTGSSICSKKKDFRATISCLVEGWSAGIEIDEQMAYQMFVIEYSLPIYTDRSTRPADMSMPELWTLIYYAGYLTKVVSTPHHPFTTLLTSCISIQLKKHIITTMRAITAMAIQVIVTSGMETLAMATTAVLVVDRHSRSAYPMLKFYLYITGGFVFTSPTASGTRVLDPQTPIYSKPRFLAP